MAFPALAAAGLLTQLGGGFLRGKAADMARNRLEDVANTPGIDVDAETLNALQTIQKYLPQAQGIGSAMNTFNQAELEKAMAVAQPGYANRRSTVLSNIDEWLSGKIPADSMSEIYRNAATGAIRGGYSGAPLQFGNLLRLTGAESEARKRYGVGLMSSLQSMFPTAPLADVSQLTGLTPTQLINLRSQERAQRMSLMAQQAVMPGQTAVWGDTLTQMGGAMMGAGLMGIGNISFPSKAATTAGGAGQAAGGAAMMGAGGGMGGFGAMLGGFGQMGW